MRLRLGRVERDSVVVYNSRQRHLLSQYSTGGPRYVDEVLLPYLKREGYAFSDGIKRFETTAFSSEFRRWSSSIIEVFAATARLRKTCPNILIPVSDDPLSLTPCLLAYLLKRDITLLIPIAHLIRPPKVRPGPRLRNSLSYLWQQFVIWTGIAIGAKFVVINEITHRQILRYTSCVLFRKARRNSPVKLIQPAAPVPREHTSVPMIRHFVVLGRIIEHKGSLDIPSLLKELSLLTEEFWRCSIIGNGSSQSIARMMSKARKLGVEMSITLCGQISNGERDEIQSSACALVLLSHEEGYSYVIHDAIADGRRIVCWDLPELRTLWGSYPQVSFFRLGAVKEVATFLEYLLKTDSEALGS